ncbi:MAG: PKD domain-containing protein [Bacteroidales bacterium]|nr:PKD domain-containing protein [Bacteroidales bacterium]
MRKIALIILTALSFSLFTFPSVAQDEPVSPGLIITGVYHGETPPLRDLPVLTEADWQAMEEEAAQKMLNPKLRTRSYPYAATALPKGPDPVWQQEMPAIRETVTTLANFEGQQSSYWPPDCNGTAGPNHYMQTINSVYAIYDKTGTLVAGPSNLNTLFSGVTGSSCNDGDPIILYDEQAERWLIAEFSICGSNDYMLVAVSTTNDPTGTWHKYSFDVDDMPDYEKLGIWQDGYYMGTNTAGAGKKDIYVFERSKMLQGLTAQMVGFDNPWRPTTVDGFMCVPPLDNDGTFAPTGEPGLFITINDDAIGGGSDQLWIYELDVDWVTPANSTFTRVQQLNVAAFDSNFGTNWDNIKQLGTSQELDGIPQVIMNPPQYRNFGSYETIVCCHTVDVDNTDHAGIRWYELRRVSSGNWTVRQQGTYAPDSHSRWMGSIMLNGQNEIGLGYSVSSTTMYPAIRYCGQSSSNYNSASGVLDIAEQSVQAGVTYQSTYNRWGDYAAMQVDPTDDDAFWFTSQYPGTGGTRKTRVVGFVIGPVALNANFSAGNTTPVPNTTVLFNDLSTGGATSWTWSFTPNTVTYMNSTSSASQNPQVSFNQSGYYSVSLTVSNGSTNDTETKPNYIFAYTPGLWTGATSADWNTASNWDGGILPTSNSNITFPPSAPNLPLFSGDFTVGVNCNNLTFNSSSELIVTGNFTINPGETVNMTAGGTLIVGGNWTNNGTFNAGTGTVRLNGTGAISVANTQSTLDITAYNLSTFSKSMTALTGATTGPTGDDGYANVPVGFNFNYCGNNYSTITLSTNGWIAFTLATVTGHDNAALFTNTLPNATVAAWWDDLSDDITSVVYYKTEGVAPNRIFTAEWNRVLTYYTGASARISYQTKLFKTSNKIEFHYGTAESGTHSGSESASIGVEDATGGSGHFKEATTGSTTTGVTNLVSPGTWPAVNYRYLRPETTLTFSNIIINNTGGNVNFSNNTNVTGNFLVMPGGSFTVSTGKTLNVQGTSIE